MGEVIERHPPAHSFIDIEAIDHAEFDIRQSIRSAIDLGFDREDILAIVNKELNHEILFGH